MQDDQGVGREEESSKQYVVEVGLRDGETLTGEPGEGAGEDPALGTLDQRLASDSFVAVSERLIVRSEEVRFVRIREADQSSGLLGSIKDKLGGGSQMSGYGQSGGYEEATEVRGGRSSRGSGGQQPGFLDEYVGYGRRPWSETKPFFMTSEFLTLLLAAIGVGVAIATSDLLDAHHGWTLMTALAIGYMLSCGLAKSGARDPNPDRRYRD